MQLTRHTDIVLRVLLLVADTGAGGLTAEQVVTRLRLNLNHLAKVVQVLAWAGFITAKRGVGGELVMARAAEEINLVDVVSQREPELDLPECFSPKPAPLRLPRRAACSKFRQGDGCIFWRTRSDAILWARMAISCDGWPA